MDQPGPGGRARRADRRSRQWSPPRRGGSQIHPGDCRARLQRGGEQAYRLADNELAARGSWDLDLLRSELGDLKFSGFDLDLIGFEPDRLDEILRGLGSSGLSDPDTVPDVSDQPVTVPGDIWRSGADNDFMAKALAESGIFVASIDFRMPPAAPHPGSAQDINLGIPWLKANAREFQGRPEWIGSWGTSSGGD